MGEGIRRTGFHGNRLPRNVFGRLFRRKEFPRNFAQILFRRTTSPRKFHHNLFRGTASPRNCVIYTGYRPFLCSIPIQKSHGSIRSFWAKSWQIITFERGTRPKLYSTAFNASTMSICFSLKCITSMTIAEKTKVSAREIM